MKKVLEYLLNSNLTIAFNLNPIRWGFHLDYFPPDEDAPSMHFLHVKFLCFILMIIINNGD
jgi:hypothetical protein